jgi:DNA-binding SARP family transcriptional activator/ABC-type glycerol-3-phosphate transport system substrate-binding protein
MMRFRVLGPLEVSAESGPITLGGPKQRAVLAHLLVRANQVVPAEALIDQVWGDEPPEAARNTLQTYVSHLRKALGADRLEGRTPGYVLHVEPDELDAARFERLLHEARSADGQADSAAAILREALGLWRGPAFADLAGEESLSGEIARLEELRIQALEERLAADLASGRHADVVAELESLTRGQPLRERLWASLMLALYRSGRQADALAVFQRARQILADELGVDPSPELVRLQERVLRQDPDLEIQGEPLRGYRLLEQIGEGAFGVVYRAIQPQVGREVAVKSIHPELANQPDFVRRFEREAQLVARLEHPHVVPLYDYWREPDAAYLIMRFLRGGSLEDLLGEGGLDVDRAAGILDQVASALAAAHRQGVVHRDVKPGNVLLDEDGNAYLSDFGVALGVGVPEQTSGTMVRGTPAYLSPEQIRLESLTPRSDIYSLGIMLYEMLTAEHPFPDGPINVLLEQHLQQPLPSVRGVRPELPPTVDAVIARATAKHPDQRFSDALEVAAAFRAAAESHPLHAASVGEIRNPYKGLRAFLEADAADFFGRETLVRRLAERLAEPGTRSRFLCVVGPSGSGKSSVVRAGLVPALRRGAVAGSERWFFVDVTPGPHPLRELESALLGIAIQPPPSLLDELERDELGLARAVDRVLPDPDAELLIVLDQLEEVFTLVEDDSERSLVLESVRAAVEAPDSRVRIVATLRADFFDQPLSVRGFGDLLAERTEAITPMSPEQLERAIAGPAEHVGLEVEPGLIAAMVTDVADRPGALPLLQYALTELAERGQDILTLDAYREIGRASGALARRSEALFQSMNETASDACRQLFLRLVTLGEGMDDTRHRVRRSELRTLTDARALDEVIETFGRHRLLSFDRDPDTREPTVEIAHEAILGAWARLRDWIEASREELRARARISAAAGEWIRAGRKADDLLTGGRLAQSEEAVAGGSIGLTETEREFLEASLARREADREAERRRHERELGLERRALTRLRGLVAVLAVAILVAASLTAVAVSRTREAERRRDETTIAGLTAGALSSLETDPELGLLLALQAVNISATLGAPVPAETVEALHWAIQEMGVEYPVRTAPTAVATSPAGTRGVFDLPVADLANLARSSTSRSLTSQECQRFFAVATCPPLPDRFPATIASEPLRARTPAPSPPLAGTSVVLLVDVADAGLVRDLNRFGAQTGIDIQFVRTSDDLIEQFQRDPPDVAFIDQPGLAADLADEERLMDLGTYLDVDQMRRDYSPYLLSMGSIGPDGLWPTEDGSLFGATVAVNLKSLIWYPVPEFERAGYTVPHTWGELLSLTDRMRADGRTPWCMGLESDLADGWPATDWIENLLLGGAGPGVYDRWTSHRIPFDHPAVRRAFERLGQIVFEDGDLFQGVGGALVTPFQSAQHPMVDGDPPECWLYHFPSFASGYLPRGSVGSVTDAFRFPSPNPRHADVLLGGGVTAVAFTDRPEVREVMRFLVSPAFGEHWFTSGAGQVATNRRFDTTRYEPVWRRQAELLNAALAADTFRFDGSDLLPAAVGTDPFWDAMLRYLSEGPKSLDEILTKLDALWPK